ncbi:MAG: glutamate racemase [Planctomycetota bacterium]
MPATRPILIFDAGLGGLTVAEAIATRCPGQPLVYVGDTAGGPYGTKSPRFVADRATRLIRAFRDSHDPCHVVVACNTTSAVAIDEIRSALPGLGISGVVEPGARAVSSAAGDKVRPTLGVMATSAALRSRAYHVAVGTRRMRSRILLRPGPLLAPMVEEGRPAADPLVKAAIREYTRPMRHAGVDVLLLGCGHFAVYRQTFERYMPKAVVIDSATATADDLARRLNGNSADATDAGLNHEFHVTDDPDRFRRLARRVCDLRVTTPTLVDFDRLGENKLGDPEQPTTTPLRAAG